MPFDLPPAPDDVDAEAELTDIERKLGEMQQQMTALQTESSRLLLRAQFLQGCLSRARTFDATDVSIEGVDAP